MYTSQIHIMKKLIILLLCFIPLMELSAQKAEAVYSFALVKKSTSWYHEQIVAWKKVIDTNPKDGKAWYNYYYANRNALRTDPKTAQDPVAHKAKMDKVMEAMGKAIPDAYEYHVCMWMDHGNDFAYHHHLEKAIEMGEGRWEHLDFVINEGEISRDLKMRNEACLARKKEGLVSPGMMYYNHNVLTGLKPNAILLTAGDNDTYPAWTLQAMGFREDVKVINLSLILVDDYRERIYKELGIKNFTTLDWDSKDETSPKHLRYLQKTIIETMATNTKGFPVYVGNTAMGAPHIVDSVKNELYLTGLAYLYCEESVDERALLKKNFEQNYALDYIEYAYFDDLSEGLVPIMNQNYIVPMLKLYDHYKLAGDLTKMAWMRDYIIQVSKGNPSEKAILEHLNMN